MKKDRLPTFENFLNEQDDKEKWSKDVEIKSGKMRELLGVPDDEKFEDHYKGDEKKLVKDLIAKTDRSEAASMINFVANVDPHENIFDRAQKYLSSEESK